MLKTMSLLRSSYLLTTNFCVVFSIVMKYIPAGNMEMSIRWFSVLMLPERMV